MPEFVIHPVGEHPQGDSQLWCRQPYSGGVAHRVGEVLDQAAQFLVEGDHFGCWRAENGVTEQTNRNDAHQPQSRCAAIGLHIPWVHAHANIAGRRILC